MRSLADDLRARSQEQLQQLLQLRVDALDPVPLDLSQLASGLSTAGSVKQALDGLNRAELTVLMALAKAEPIALEPADAIDPLLQRLWEIGLLWGAQPGSAPEEFKVITAAREILARDVSTRPAESLTPRRLRSEPVQFAKLVNVQAGQHALAAVSSLVETCQYVSMQPLAILRSGGVAARDLAALSTHLGVDEATTGFWLELAHRTHLIGIRHGNSTVLTASTHYDVWRHLELGEMWAQVALAWLQQTRDLDKLFDVNERVPVLSELPHPAWLPPVRKVTLQALADAPAGEAPDFDELVEHLADLRPRVPRNRLARIAAATIREGELLGVIFGGSLTSLGRSLIEPHVSAHTIADGAAAAMPALAEQFMAQADLTLVVPGPPSVALREFMDSFADIESIGGAIVYRVNEASIGRAIGAGWDPEELLAAMRARSATPLPQPLEYQVSDAARRVGQTTVGAAKSFVVSADETVIDTVLQHIQAGEFGIVRLAPTVAVAQVGATELAELLRQLGISAGGAGAQIYGSNAPMPRAPELAEEQADAIDEVFISALANALVRSEVADEDRPGRKLPAAPAELPRMATAVTAHVLRSAQVNATPVWIGYADNAGSTSRRLVDVVAIASGAVSAFDHATGRIRTLVLSRITGAQVLDGQSDNQESPDKRK